MLNYDENCNSITIKSHINPKQTQCIGKPKAESLHWQLQ